MKKSGIVLALVCLLLCLCGCGAKSRAYKQAQALMDAAQYAQAAEAFHALGTYRDAADKTLKCKYLLAEDCMHEPEQDIPEAVRLFAELGDYADAKAQMEALQETYYFPEFARQIPAPESVIPDAVRSEETGEDENGRYCRYTYTWEEPDLNALSDRFAAWLSKLDEADGVDAQPYLNGAYTILVGGERVGLTDSVRSDDNVQIRVTLYTDAS